MNRKVLTFALISLCFCISSVSSQCCDFETSDCNWEGNWHFSANELPDVSYYPNFTVTQPSANYIWIEDTAGNVTLITPFTLQSSDSIISFNYFISNLYTSYPNELVVRLSNADTNEGIVNIYMSDNLFTNTWLTERFTCSYSGLDCCKYGYPCNIQITFQTYLGMYGQGLYGVDNVGSCN